MSITRTRTRPKARTLAVAALIGAVFFWAGNYFLGGYAATSMPLTSLMFLKWGTALIPLLLITQFTERPDWKAALKHWKYLTLLACLGILGYGFMLYAALTTTTGFNASLINAFNPALIMLAATVFLRDKLTGKGIIGILIALAGVIWSLADGNLTALFTNGLSIGDLWMLGVIGVWTAYTIIIRVGPKIPALTATSLQVGIAVVLMIPLVAIQGIHLPNTTEGAWSLAYIAIFPSIVSYYLYNYGSKHIQPGQAGAFLNLTTVFVAIFAVIAGQSLTLASIVGGILILGGITLSTDWRADKSEANAYETASPGGAPVIVEARP